jgi:2-dehydropantoate 2-reductase
VRYVIYGAGGVGASLAAQLHLCGRDVSLVARGRQLAALRDAGLLYRTPVETQRLHLPVAGSPGEIDIGPDDVVVLAMKSQDTAPALADLLEASGSDPAVVCAQNGVYSERMALRLFPRVYGMSVWIPATFLEPGVVLNYWPSAILGLGRYPSGAGELGHKIVDDLESAGFTASLEDRVMRWKYAKLLTNIQTALDALCGSRAGLEDVCKQLQTEAEACYAAAGIEYASGEEQGQKLALAAGRMGEIDGKPRGGGSGVQSLSRGAGSIETDYINGEITLLGRLHDVPTPANQAVQTTAREIARRGLAPGSIPPDELRSRIRRLGRSFGS